MTFLVPAHSVINVTCNHYIIYDMTLVTQYDKFSYPLV